MANLTTLIQAFLDDKATAKDVNEALQTLTKDEFPAVGTAVAKYAAKLYKQAQTHLKI